MSPSVHAAQYADHAVQLTVPLLENVPLARNTYRARIRCPEIARAIVPGQFVMLRFRGASDPLLGRPLALYDTVLSAAGEAEGIDLVYVVRGKFTRLLANCGAGQKLDVWGPLGNGFPPLDTRHLILVAGGIGHTPFLALCKEAFGHRRYGNFPRQAFSCSTVTLCYGVRSRDWFAGVDAFSQLGVAVRLATEDGSEGHRGLVTQVLEQVLRETELPRRLVACGPEPMLRVVARLAAENDTPCLVALETPMACGIGICFSCVVRVRDPGGGWDYRRSCVDGPVFDAAVIEW